MNSLAVKLPISQEFGRKSINLHHFGTKYTHHPSIRRIVMEPPNKINGSIEKQ